MTVETTAHFDLDIRLVGHNLESEQLVSIALTLSKILAEIKSSGVSQDTARLIKAISPTANIPSLEHYTVLPTVTNLNVSLESVGSELIKLIREIIAKGQALIMRFLEWLKSKFTDKKNTHNKIKKHTQKLLAIKEFKAELAPLVDLETETTVAEHPQITHTVEKVDSTYTQLVERLVRSPKHIELCHRLLANKHVLLNVTKLIMDHYKKLIQDPAKILDSAIVNVDNPVIQLNGIQHTLDGILDKINRDLTQLATDGPKESTDDRPTEYTIALLNVVIDSVNKEHLESGSLSDNTTNDNIERIKKIAALSDKLVDPKETELEQDIRGLLSQLKQLVDTPVKVPDDIDPVIRRGMIRQAHLHQLYINELLHIVSKIDTLTKFVLDALAKHVVAVSNAATAETKVTAQVITPKARTDEQQKALLDKIDAFLNGDIDGFTDKP